MGAPVVTSGVYLLCPDGSRIPLRKEIMVAFKKFMDGRLNGSIVIHFNQGLIRSIEDRMVYLDNTQ